MKLRRFIEASLLLAGGFILHHIMPPLVAGMKPDMSLLMLFVVILLYQERSLTLSSGLVAGIISALTTTFPGGQVANLVDKPITAITVLGLVVLTDKVEVLSKLKLGIIGIAGTIVSGSIFLGTASLIVSLPQSFVALFISVVLPATLLNTVALYFLYPVVAKIKGMMPTTDVVSNDNKAA
ncbi:tryptophan transporter [Halanaerocella petrolearia]